MPNPSEFDPIRLTHLARSRDTKRAYARSLYDRYQDLRTQRQDVQRRMELARLNAQSHHGQLRLEAEEGINALKRQYDDLTAQLTESQAESDAVAEESGETARLLRACLSFAVEKGLSIPSSLTEEATPLNFAPLASVGGAA